MMEIERQISVERRMMGKQELAHLYFPHSKGSAATLRNELMAWIKRCTPLFAKLQELGYEPSVHTFTPRMVDYIFYYLGEPDGV